MWIPEWQRDRLKDVKSPMPTQVVSNEELIPRPGSGNRKGLDGKTTRTLTVTNRNPNTSMSTAMAPTACGGARRSG